MAELHPKSPRAEGRLSHERSHLDSHVPMYAAGRPHPLPTTPEAVIKARRLLEAVPQLHVRDALHAAVMETHGIDTIVSAGQSFARIPNVRWIPLDRWEVLLRGSVSG